MPSSSRRLHLLVSAPVRLSDGRFRPIFGLELRGTSQDQGKSLVLEHRSGLRPDFGLSVRCHTVPLTPRYPPFQLDYRHSMKTYFFQSFKAVKMASNWENRTYEHTDLRTKTFAVCQFGPDRLHRGCNPAASRGRACAAGTGGGPRQARGPPVQEAGRTPFHQRRSAPTPRCSSAA